MAKKATLLTLIFLAAVLNGCATTTTPAAIRPAEEMLMGMSPEKAESLRKIMAIPPKLKVNTVPADAEVEVDGVPIHGMAEVSPAEHTVVVKHNSFPEKRVDIFSHLAEDKVIFVDLTDIPQVQLDRIVKDGNLGLELDRSGWTVAFTGNMTSANNSLTSPYITPAVWSLSLEKKVIEQVGFFISFGAGKEGVNRSYITSSSIVEKMIGMSLYYDSLVMRTYLGDSTSSLDSWQESSQPSVSTRHLIVGSTMSYRKYLLEGWSVRDTAVEIGAGLFSAQSNGLADGKVAPRFTLSLVKRF